MEIQKASKIMKGENKHPLTKSLQIEDQACKSVSHVQTEGQRSCLSLVKHLIINLLGVKCLKRMISCFLTLSMQLNKMDLTSNLLR